MQQVLSKTELKKYGKMSNGKMRIQLVANQNVVFKFLRAHAGVRLLFVGPSDVVDGHPMLVLGLMWSLMTYFSAKEALGPSLDPLGDEGESVDAKVPVFLQMTANRLAPRVSFWPLNFFHVLLAGAHPAHALAAQALGRTWRLVHRRAPRRHGPGQKLAGRRAAARSAPPIRPKGETYTLRLHVHQ